MNKDKPTYEDLQNRIKELENAEIKLRNQDSEMQLLLKSMLNAFVIFDSVFDEAGEFVSYRFLFINDAYEKITGVKNDEVKGKTVHEVWPGTEQSWVEKYGHVALTGETLEFDNYHEPTGKLYHCKVYRPWETTKRFCVIFDDITEQQQTQNELKKIEWLLKPKSKELTIAPSEYGDLTTLNTNGLILKSVGKNVLKGIVQDYLSLLDTSAAIYEENGDYALGIFSSNWCNMLDNASRKLCGKCTDADALDSGAWLCHESCWTDVSKKAIETGNAVDMECNGGLRIYAIPIRLNNKVIGAINFGYGNPPTDKEKLMEISNKYKIPYAQLLQSALKYETRPPFIIDIAKERLDQSARIISEIVSLNLAEKKIQYQNEEINSQNEELTAQNEEIISANINLLKSEEKLQKLFHHMSSGFAFHKIVLDESGNPVDYIFKEINTAFEKMTGLKAEDIIGKKVTETIPGIEKDSANWINLYGKVALSGTPTKFQNYSADLGKWFSVSAYSPVKGYFATIFEDITEWKLAEQKVNESENKYRSLFDNINVGSALHEIILDQNGKPVDFIFLDANPAYEKFTQLKRKDIIGKRGTEVIPNLEQKWIEIYGKVAITGESISIVEHSAYLDSYWDIKAYCPAKNQFAVALSDITHQIKAKQELAAKEELYRSLLESVSAGIGYYDLKGKLLMFNTQGAKNLNGKPKDFEGKTIVELFGEELGKFYLDRIHLAAKSKGILEFEDSVDLPGEKKWFNSKYNKIYNEKGETIGVQIISYDITDLKNAEQSLIASETKYRSYVENAPHGIFVVDEKGNYLDANPTAAKMTGFEVDEILQMTIADFSLDNEASRIAGQRFSQLQKNEKMSVKIPFRKKNGSTGWWQIDAVKISYAKFLGFTTDITEQKHAEDALLLSESKYRQLVETASDAIYLISDTGKILDVNNTSCQMLGRTKEEFQRMVINEVDPNFHLENFKEFWDKIPFDQQTIFETFHKTKDGRQIPVEVSGKKFRIGNEVFYYGIARDITERKQAQKNLIRAKEKAEESEHKIRSMFENTLTGILFCDTKGSILEANPAVLKIMGSPSLEISKQINLITYKPLKEIGFSQNIQKCLKENIVISDEVKYTSRYGKTVFLKYSLVPILVNKIPIGVWANLNDLTDLWQTQNDLQSAKEKAEESDRLKSAFLANMSHEIRTPMNGILGFASLLNEPGLSGEEQKKYAGIIEKSGERMLNIINDLIDISKIEAGQMEVKFTETNIHDQAEYLCTFFKPEMEKKGLELFTHFQVKDAPLTFWTDREKLYAIITNLLKNAIKYTNEGSIEFGYHFYQDGKSNAETPDRASIPDQKNHQDANNSVQTPDRASLSNHQASLSTHQINPASLQHHPSQPNRSMLQFYVKDTGIGIPEDRIEAVFERFIQADIEDKKAQEGAGLGLAISKAYVEMLGGKIWVESVEGAGSTFYFTIEDKVKIEQSSNPEKMKVEHKEEIKTRQLKILVAEDDATSKMHLSIILENIANDIIYADTGPKAVELCRNNPDIDLVLMDIKLPVMNGYDATREIRKFNKKVIVIAQTAYALSGDREKSLAAGCNDYIAKPVKKEVLFDIIKNLLWP